MSDTDGMDLYRVVQELRTLYGGGGRCAVALRDAELARSHAVRTLEARKAHLRAEATGTVQAKDDAALLGSVELWETADDAKAAETYAKAMARAHESDQSNLQTQAALIRAAMNIAGVAER